MADGPYIDPALRGKRADDRILELATGQHGVVALSQMLALGIGTRAIEFRLEAGRLHGIHRGVYAVGHPILSPLARCMAAALAGGPCGSVAHLAAAWIWDLAETLPETIDVRCPTRRRSRRGLRFHEGLPPDERAVRESIPVTIPARTLLDLAPRIEPHRLERMLVKAEDLRLNPGTLTLAALLDRYPRKPGTPRIERLLGLREENGAAQTRSDPEVALLHLCDGHAIPRPLTSYLIEAGNRSWELDAFWPEQRLALEYDSWEFHGNRVSFREDRIRDRVLATIGIRTVRATAFDLGAGAAAFAADLRLLLGLAAG